jgi:hypothetical protein
METCSPSPVFESHPAASEPIADVGTQMNGILYLRPRTMLSSLRINGFKLFRNLEIQRLNRVNLFIGNNNSGKTGLLEAIRVYESDAAPRVLREILGARDGDWNVSPRREEAEVSVAPDSENAFRLLFNDFHYRGDPPPSIWIDGGDGTDRLSLRIDLFQQIHSEAGTVRYEPVKPIPSSQDDEIFEMLEINVGSHRRQRLRFDRMLLRRLYSPTTEPTVPISVVTTSGVDDLEVGRLFDQVSLTRAEDLVLECLRLIEPRIDGIAMVGGPETRRRIPIVGIEGVNERFPLRTMGDGLTRIFHIALAMVNAKGGVAIIDEFENGLYWEVQGLLWPLIFKMAEALNIQLFVTTHSNDCLRGFTSAWQLSPDAGTLYRLERDKSQVKAIELPLRNVADAIATEIEVR